MFHIIFKALKGMEFGRCDFEQPGWARLAIQSAPTSGSVNNAEHYRGLTFRSCGIKLEDWFVTLISSRSYSMTATAPATTQEWKRWIPSTPVLCAWVVLLVVVGYSHRAALLSLAHAWSNPDYGHGPFVPLFSLYLLWHRRTMVESFPAKGSWWCVPFFALSAAISGLAVYFHYSIDGYALFPLLIGLTLLMGNWRALHWAWPSIVFLVFMMPLPGFVVPMLSGPLQGISTKGSIYVIQVLGIPAVAEGNVINLATQKVDVADACSGIRMLMLFLAVCVGAAMVLQLEVWERLVIAFSAIPIAIISNIARVTIAAILSELVGLWAEKGFHDYVGWIMMIFALMMLWAEMKLLSALLIKPSQAPLILTETRLGSERKEEARRAALRR